MNIEKLNEERKRQKISISELAEKANLPKGTVEKILFGIVKNPRIDTMQAIEHALGLDETAGESSPALPMDEEELLRNYRSLSPALKKAAINTVRALAGETSEGGLQKKA